MKGSEGYFLAKREVQSKLEGRISVLKEKLEKARKESNYTALTLILLEIDVVDSVRNQMRNTLLWNSSNGE